MICKQCGAQIDDNAVECQFCGAAYDENIIPEPVEEENVLPTDENEENISPEDEHLGVENSEIDVDELMDENEAKRLQQVERLNAEKQSQIKEIEKRRKKKRFIQKRNKILVGILIVAIIAALGGGGYMLWKESKEKPSIIIPTPTPTIAATVTPVASPSPTPTATVDPSQSPLPDESEQPSVRPITPSEAQNGESSQSVSGTQSSTAGNVSVATAKPNVRPVQTAKPQATKQPTTAVTPATAKPAATKPNTSANTQTSVSSVKPSTSDVSFGGKEYNADGGYSDGKFSSALVTGVEVVPNGDKAYMSFKFNGATYYANVSSTTTTNFVNGRPMTVSAYKTSETYNGSPIYEITAITNYTGKNILPKSGFELLTEADLAGLSPAELRLARNEIYARHGRSFKDAELRKYFESCSWYKVKKSYNYSNESANLNSIEKANINFILKHEK